jgi:guanylate kinase
MSHIEALRRTNDVLWENSRYGALYAVDRDLLTEELKVRTPILHLGQVEAVKAVTTAVPATQWVVVWLWCPRHVAIDRIAERGTDDAAARMRAWDETEPLPDTDVCINTADVRPTDAAATIHRKIQS